MKRKFKGKKGVSNDFLMWGLISFCGGYILPSICCWQMVSLKQKKSNSGLGEVVPMHSQKG
ncbi:MAG: hypothetical protein KAG53_02495 [Endozoicomonadaceae bacterium]|nr:hypothetical protein [Endozoicomonadaceae bacterium]